jgi:hypothetical protein
MASGGGMRWLHDLQNIFQNVKCPHAFFECVGGPEFF